MAWRSKVAIASVVLTLGIGGCTVERDQGCILVTIPPRDDLTTPDVTEGSVRYWFCPGTAFGS